MSELTKVDFMSDKEVEQKYDALMGKPVEEKELTDEEKIQMIMDMSPKEEPLPTYIPTEEDLRMEKEGEQVTVQTNNGHMFNTGNMNHIVNGINSLLEKSAERIKIDPEKVLKVFHDYMFNYVTMEDAEKFTVLVERYMNKEKFSYYQASPENIKKAALTLNGIAAIGNVTSAQAKNIAIVHLFDEVIQQHNVDQTYLDLDTELRAAAQELQQETADHVAEASSHKRERYVFEFLELAEKYKAEGKDESAKMLLSLRDGFIESFTLDKFYEFVKSHPMKIRKIDLEDKHFWRKVTEWSAKYATCKQAIINPKTIIVILEDQYKDLYPIKDIRRMMLYWFEMTKPMSPDNIVEHTTMYYFFYNINQLYYSKIHSGTDIEFYQKFKARLGEIISGQMSETNKRIYEKYGNTVGSFINTYMEGLKDPGEPVEYHGVVTEEE